VIVARPSAAARAEPASAPVSVLTVETATGRPAYAETPRAGEPVQAPAMKPTRRWSAWAIST
jgi:hypothetical protein